MLFIKKEKVILLLILLNILIAYYNLIDLDTNKL
jgi:hypothetical protein